MLGTSGVVPELAPWQEHGLAGSCCSLFWVAVLLPDGELVLCSVFCPIPMYSFFCDEGGFLCCCSAEWEESIPVKKFFVQSAAGVLYLSHIRSHLSPPSVLLCSQSICSWIQSCLAFRAEYVCHGTLVVSAKGNLVVQGQRQKNPLLHIVYSRLSRSILWSCCTFVHCLCWHTGISVFTYMGEKSCCLGS